MAFELKRIQVHRAIATISCGCQIMQEFQDPRYKEKLTDPVYKGCAKHEGKESADTIELILNEFMETEITKAQTAPPPRTGGEVVKDKDGNVIGNRIASAGGNHRPKPKVRTAAAAIPHAPTQEDFDMGGVNGALVDNMLASPDPKVVPNVDAKELMGALDVDDPTGEEILVPDPDDAE